MDGYGTLTAKQDTFCRQYLVDLNATAAARRAGYSARNADKIGSELLGKTGVAARISELRAEAAKRNEITLDDVIQMLVEDRRDAKAAGQHGPAVRAAELLGKHLGAFTDRMILSQDQVSDEDIIKAIAGDDERKAAMLRDILGSDTEFAPLRPVNGSAE